MDRVFTLPDFELPSRPGTIVRLHEATVGDAIDFADIDPRCEEEATTQFLDRIQVKEKHTDPRLWTGEDRRFALFMYHINTTKFHDIPMSYRCNACSTKDKPVHHTISVKLADIADSYTPLQGAAVREIVHEGRSIQVHPLRGEGLELLEKARLNIELLEGGSGDIVARKQRAQMRLLRILCCIDVPGLAPEKSEADRREDVEKYIVEMPASRFKELYAKILNCLAEMEHGLPSEYEDGRIVLKTPPVKCPEGKDGDEAGVTLRFQFRTFDYVPFI